MKSLWLKNGYLKFMKKKYLNYFLIFSSVPGVFGVAQNEHLDTIKRMLGLCLQDKSIEVNVDQIINHSKKNRHALFPSVLWEDFLLAEFDLKKKKKEKK